MMETVEKVIGAFREGLEEYENIKESGSPFRPFEIYGKEEGCRLALGENLSYMGYLRNHMGMEGKVKLIYIDPPFFSRGSYLASVQLESAVLGRSVLMKTNAYEDRWNGDVSLYIRMLTPRLMMMRDLLREDGLIAVHVDWHAVHFVRMVMDEIFGGGNLVNEIIWTYKSGGSTRRSFSKKHDTILLYSRTGRYTFNPQKEKSYNRDMRPYRFKGVEEFRDEKGWYTMVNMKDVWSIDMVGRTSSERTGYATQKPVKLLERLIRACTSEGDICADFFAGSGSLGRAAVDLGRKWIMCDMSRRAAADQIRSLSKASFTAESQQAAEQECSVRAMRSGEKIVLHGYMMDEKCILCDNIDEVKRYLEKDSLSLIRQWTVSRADDGEALRPLATAADGERSLSIPDITGDIVVAGYDVFGNRFRTVIKEDQGE